MNRVVLEAPAKINPVLRVLGKRPDGLHEVHTTLLALDCTDTVTVELRPRAPSDLPVTVELRGAALTDDVPADASNLAARAALLVLELNSPSNDGLHLTLNKRIPSQAGLGGGSSDAAAAALGAARVLGLNEDDPRLLAGLRTLGADVPFFFSARDTGFGLGTGTGDSVEVLTCPPTQRAFCVLTPRVTCATPVVYAALGATDEVKPVPQSDPNLWCTAAIDDARASFVNDLEVAALRSHAELARLRADLDAGGGAHFRLSGSGSSFFGLFDSEDEAGLFLRSDLVRSIDRDYGLRAQFVAKARGRGVGTSLS